ncbi:hypothetical protein KKG71_01590 [Patescibacteria group bacterium]|nr:hypothetical protein [Patescibacteria group bacterium]
MQKIKFKKWLLLFYHVITLAIAWYFSVAFKVNMAQTLSLDIHAGSLIWQVIATYWIVLLQSVVFLIAMVDGFSSFCLWWTKKFSLSKNKNAKFFTWLSTIKSSQKKNTLFGLWQVKVMSIYLMVNTFLLAAILVLIFYTSSLNTIFYVASGLLAICGLSLFISIKLFLKWLSTPVESQ